MSAARDDVAQFAALLTELKERTERSYGSLGRRVGMNTSTLHRYCAGDAVPQDFAPVERLAQFCGASPEERLELHRRWLLAVAARQRPRTAGSAEAEDEEEKKKAAKEAAEAADVPQKPEVPANLEAPANPDVPEKRDVPGTPETQSAPDAQVDPGPARPPRPWHHRRVTLLAALACALLATLGTLSALPADRPSSSDTARSFPTTPSRTTAPAAPHPSPTPTTSPSPSPSPSPTARTIPPSPGAPKPSPSASRTTPPQDTPAAVPLTWTADSQAWALGCGHDYVVAKPPAQVPPPPAPQDARPWATAQGAVHGRETNVEISVQGRSSTAVVLTALRVRVVGRTDPTPGNAYAMDQGCGGSISPRHFAVDLDKDRPIARAVPGNDSGTPIPAVRMPYRVSAEDPEVLLVTARTQACDCSWYLELDWSSQGRTGTVRVDDHGRPFRTRSIAGLPHYTYDTSARRWTPSE
nr:helix-turn-helix transcriptional regulator [Streptomyces aurantiogriseus]